MRRGKPIAVLAIETELLPLVREVLLSEGVFPLVARGDSMGPVIAPGDRLILGPLGSDPVREGELVLWSHAGTTVVHRVVAVRAGEVKTRGDARTEDDGWVPLSALVGRVSRVERRTGLRGRAMHLVRRGLALLRDCR